MDPDRCELVGVSCGPPCLSREAAVTVGLASTVIPFTFTREERAERWLRVLRCEGQVGTALRALGVPEAPLGTAEPPPDGNLPPLVDGVRKVADRAVALARLRGQPTVGTVEILFAVLEIYPEAFVRSLHAHGVTLELLVARLPGRVRVE